MRSTVKLDGQEVDFEQLSTSATFGWQASPRLGLVASLGSLVAGSVDVSMGGDFGVGALASVSVTALALFETARRPFLLASFTVGGVTAKAQSDDGQDHRWTAFDMRLGLMVGKTFADRFVPFITARAFAGPVSWRLGGRDVTGSDIYKYTVGGGLTIRVPGTLDVFAEALPLGARSLSIGGSASF